jgi:hypothetical protein
MRPPEQLHPRVPRETGWRWCLWHGDVRPIETEKKIDNKKGKFDSYRNNTLWF